MISIGTLVMSQLMSKSKISIMDSRLRRWDERIHLDECAPELPFKLKVTLEQPHEVFR